ncbi:Mycothiol acetyltransferase [bioreactor metagenome]|uniref:Mycothiol acetyltransferase n=1 Tax=bioreactor metagenome TaxID=1076179 RepID=A0A644ZTE1_9ZZZZ
MELVFEKGRAQDIEEIGRLYDDLCDYLSAHVNYPGWIKGFYPTLDTAAEGVRTDTLFIAKCNDTIVGTVILNGIPETGYESANWAITTTDYSDVFVMHTLAVHPDYLKYGVGRFLLQSGIDYAKNHGFRALRLDVNDQNEPAMRLYEALGFQYVGTVDLGLGKYGLDWFKLYELVL